MKRFLLIFIMISLFGVNLIAQSNEAIYRYFFKTDSSYVIIDDSRDNWFTIEFKADTLFQDVDNRIIYDNKKLLQINLIPFYEILPNKNKSISIAKASLSVIGRSVRF